MQCRKISQVSSSHPASGSQLINEVINMASNKDAQKLSYKLLSNEEKAILWSEQIDFYLDSELNAMQKEKLNQLQSIISPKIFDKSYFVKHHEAFAKKWSTSAAEIFPREVLNAIVSRINTEKYAKDLIIATNAAFYSDKSTLPSLKSMNYPKDEIGGAQSCECSTESIYCDSRYRTCRVPDPACTTSSLGCGFLFLYSCNGACTGGA